MLDLLASPPALLTLSLAALAGGPAVYRITRGRPGARALLDGFVFTAIGALVFLEILPHSLVAVGPVALLAVLVGLAIPFALERSDVLSRRANAIVVGLAVLGLLVHETLDGVALSAADAGAHASALAVAVVVHRLPVAVAIWWMARPVLGVRWATAMLVGLGCFTTAGFALGEAALGHLEEAGLAFFQALMAGSLLHVLLHRPHDAPGAIPAPRWHPLEALGGAGGLALLLVLERHEELPDPMAAPSLLAERFIELALACAPALVVAYIAAGVLRAVLPRRTFARLREASPVRGATVGLLMPTCSCDLSPAYRQLLAQGVRPSTSLSFLSGTLLLGVVSVALSLPLLGAPLTGLRVAAVAAVALAAGAVTGRLSAPVRSPRAEATHWEGFRTAVLDVVDDTAPWILAGLVVLAAFEPGAAAGWFAVVPAWVAVSLSAACGTLFYIAAPGATGLAAALMAAGASPGAGLALLVTGPLLHSQTVGLVRAHHGARAALAFAALVLGLAVALGLAVDAVWPGPGVLDVAAWQLGPVSWIALGLIAFAFMVSVVRQGPRAFVHTLLPTTHRLHEHQHHHTHEHDHPAHDHDHDHGHDGLHKHAHRDSDSAEVGRKGQI